jgi:replicative DNA helicase
MEDYKGKDQKNQRFDKNTGGASGGDKNRTSDLSSFVFGKVQPQALQLEEAVLGALMLDKDALPAVMDILRPESFYTDAHQAIYRAITELFRGSKPIDLLTVTEELRKMGAIETIGGSYHLVELTNRVGSAANIEYHARIISQKHIQRELIKVSTSIIKDAYEDSTDVFDLLDKAEQSLFSITETNLSRSFEGMNTLAGKLLKQIELLSQTKSGLTGVPTGFTELDRLTSGWQPSDLVIVAARPSMGKCLAKGTPVMMFDGTLKNVEDIHTDDLLMGDDSTPRRVLSLARGRELMYWVRQKHGVDYRVNESHILSLKRSRNEGQHRHGEVENIEIKDYFNKSAKWKTNFKGYKVGVEFADTPLSIEPYFMGLWLGDGKSDSSRIYTQDKEVVEYLAAYADRLDARLSVMDEDRCPGYTIARVFGKDTPMDSVQGGLRREGVLGNKHIPKNYLLNSRKNRLELLAGLIDSDGFLNAGHGGTYEITSKHEHLARQIKYLCDTLGYRTSINSKIAKITSIGYESTVWRVRFNGNVDEIPVRIPRKKAEKWTDGRDWQVTGITVEADIVDDYYGFEIDGNHLFLLGDCTVTHNTAFTLSLARNAAMEFGKGVALFSLEMSNLQLVQRLVSMESEVGSSKLRTGQLEPHEWQQLHTSIEKMSKAPIFIDDTPGINVFELRAKCRRLKAQHDIQLIIIDYLQLMTAGTEGHRGGNREQEISAISRALKGLAKELNVPVIALSQLSRAVETRGGSKKPQLSDLRECVTGDTKIYLPETGRYVPVRDLVGQKGFTVLSLNTDTLKLENATCGDVWETGAKEIYEIETQSGHRIRTSLNHPFYTLEGWQQVVDLKVGDNVAMSRQLTSNTEGGDFDKKIRQIVKEKQDSALYKSNISRMRLDKVADILEDDYLHQLANSDIRWERIKSIEHIGNEMTYDIYVENDYHNFVAENFIIHNSGAIEQDADIVSFIYRPEYYQIMEDENGASTKGMATIIVSKHRNGALGEVNLRFVGEFSKFCDPDDFGFNNLANKNAASDANSPQNNIIRLSSRMNDDDIPAAPVTLPSAIQGQGQGGNGNSEDIPF